MAHLKKTMVYRNICGLSGDIMGMVGENFCLERHKEKFAPVLDLFKEIVEETPDFDTSVFDHEIQDYAQNISSTALGMEIDEDFCLNGQGEEWLDGRIIIEPCMPCYAVALLREIEDLKCLS